MKLRITQLFYFLIICILWTACSSGKKALERGDYAESVAKSVNRLRLSPNNRKARHTLKKAYPLALNFYTNRIEQLKVSANRRKWESIISNYRILNQLYDDIQRCPACLDLLTQVRSFGSEESAAKERAAHNRFEEGKELLAIGDRANAKKAYEQFLVTKNLLSSYPNIDQAIMESKEAATIRVIVEKVPVYSRKYRISDEYFTNKMFEFLQQNRRMNDFVRLYTTNEAVSQKLQDPEHIIRMQFDDFEVGKEQVNRDSEKISRDSVVVGRVEVEGEEREVYGTVKATLVTYSKVVTSMGLLDLKIYNAQTNQLVAQEKFRGEFVWRARWGTYQGNEQALTEQQLRICDIDEVDPPSPDELFIEFSKPIYEQVTNYIKNFYQKY